MAPVEIVSFYTDTSGWIIAGGSLRLLAIALFVFFVSGLRAILREYEGDDLFATAHSVATRPEPEDDRVSTPRVASVAGLMAPAG